jgi:hypothetical protein
MPKRLILVPATTRYVGTPCAPSMEELARSRIRTTTNFLFLTRSSSCKTPDAGGAISGSLPTNSGARMTLRPRIRSISNGLNASTPNLATAYACAIFARKRANCWGFRGYWMAPCLAPRAFTNSSHSKLGSTCHMVPSVLVLPQFAMPDLLSERTPDGNFRIRDDEYRWVRIPVVDAHFRK